MKLFPSFGEISSKTKAAFKRFPITISWAIIGTMFALLVTESRGFNEAFYGKVILTFILGVSWLIATRFFEEQFKSDKEWLMILTIVFLFLFYWHLPSSKEDLKSTHYIRFILYFISGHLLVFTAPFLLKWNKSAYFNYIKSVFIAIVRSLFFSMILYLGIILALLAINHLFNIDIDGKRYFQIFIICLGVVNTWIYLSDFPKKIHSETEINYTKAMEVLVKYILIPLVILYLIILYAYSLKIVINWNLPKGWVSYLVIALSFLGFSIQILINPIQKTIDSRSIKRFYPWFYYLLLPLIALLFVAVLRRINEYGFTENRYFVLILAIWILGMTIYMLFSKRKKIKTFPLSLAIFGLLISVGFWSVFSVSIKSQINQLDTIFNQFESKNFQITHKDKNRFRSVIQYLENRKKLNKATPILGFNPDVVFKNENRWNIANKIIDSLHIKVVDADVNSNEKYRYFNLDSYGRTFEVMGYNYFKQIQFNSSTINKYNTLRDYTFLLSNKSKTISISNENKQLIEIINLKDFISNLQKLPNNGNVNDDSYLTIKKSFKTFDVKIVFTNISLDKNEKARTKITGANGYVFIKEKYEFKN